MSHVKSLPDFPTPLPEPFQPAVSAPQAPLPIAATPSSVVLATTEPVVASAAPPLPPLAAVSSSNCTDPLQAVLPSEHTNDTTNEPGDTSESMDLKNILESFEPQATNQTQQHQPPTQSSVPADYTATTKEKEKDSDVTKEAAKEDNAKEQQQPVVPPPQPPVEEEQKEDTKENIDDQPKTE